MALAVDSVSLLSKGSSVTFTLQAGQSVGIFGPAASGKSQFARVLAGVEKPARGTVKAPKAVALAELRLTSKRQTPLGIAQKVAGPSGATRVAEALSALGLWDARKESVANLSPGQLQALDLIPVFASAAKLIVIDGTLDALDPWTLDRAIGLLAARLREGATLALATNRPEFARRMDTLVVLKQRAIVFAGTYADLERSSQPTEIVVETHHQPGVRALVAPFEVTIAKNPNGGLDIKAREGQKLAAKLLAEGYGDVKALVLHRPSAEELLRGLIS